MGEGWVRDELMDKGWVEGRGMGQGLHLKRGKMLADEGVWDVWGWEGWLKR